MLAQLNHPHVIKHFDSWIGVRSAQRCLDVGMTAVLTAGTLHRDTDNRNNSLLLST